MPNEEPEPKFPSALKYGDIKKHGSCYDAVKLEKFSLLYSGGDAFHEEIEKFLVRRQIEKTGGSHGVNGAAHWEARSEKAWYIPRGAGLIDWLVAEVFKKEVKIVCNGGTEEQKAYWEGLNENADGLGGSLSTAARDALRQILLHGRGAFAVQFTNEVGQAADPESQEGRIHSLPAHMMDDEEYDDGGELEMLRTHHHRLVRPNLWSQPDKKKRVWTYFTDKYVVEYQLIKPVSTEPEDEDSVSVVDENTYEHGFGEIPIFPVRAHREMWVMERIADALVMMFNREVSITWALDQMAYALLVLKLEGTELKNVVATEVAALKLQPNEFAEFISPSPKLYEPLFRDAERIKEALYEVIQMLAQNAIASQAQNARQTTGAKELDLGPMQTLLASFAWPIREALVNLVEALKKYRGEEELDIQVQGIDEFDATMDDLKDVLTPNKDAGPETGDDDQLDKNEADTSGGPAALRESKGVGLRDLSRRSGVSPGAISTIESGGRSPGSQTIQKLAAALGVQAATYQAAVDAKYQK